MREQAWSIACGDIAWEASLCAYLEEFLAGDESIHVVRFTATSTGDMCASTWAESLPRPAEAPSQIGSVLSDPRKHPGVQALIERGTNAPIRLSDIVDLPRFRHTEIFERLHAYPHGTRFASAAALIRTRQELVLLGCHSTKRDLSSDHMAMLGRVQTVLAPALALRRELARLSGLSANDHQPDADGSNDQWGRLPQVSPPAPPTGGDYWPTSREQQVLGLLTLGLTSRQIARRLEITERTVRKHLDSVYRKADLPSRVAAATWWQARAG